MTMNVAVYLPEARPLSVEKLRQLAPGAVIRGDGGLFRKASRFEVEWDGLTVAINRMATAEFPRHLRGFEGYVSARCAWSDPRVIERIRGTKACLGVVIEPTGDARSEALVRGLAAGGILFRDDGVYDPEGRPLATPRPTSPERLGVEPYPDGPPPGVQDPDAEEPPPPPADRVARRAVALGLVCLRGMLESDPDDGSTLRDLQARASAKGVTEELEAGERAVLMAPMGALSERAAVDASWRLQGVAVLAWALSASEVPAHDDPSKVWSILDAIGLRSAEPPPAVTSPRLRPAEELDWMARRLLGIHWRMVDFRVKPKAMDFDAFSRDCWFGSFDLTGIQLIDGDLAVYGRPIHRADPERVRFTESIARERHHAINWLLGHHWIYSEIDTST